MTWRRAGAILAGVLLALAGGYAVRNPEDRVLDQAVREAAGGEYASLTDGVTHYSLEGPVDGPAVVLVHGFSVPSYIWDSTAAALAAAGYRVLRYDLFGRGYSDRPAVRYDADLVDRQLGELLDSAGIAGPVHLMGLSFGGFVTAAFAGRHPERVRSLTLVDPVAGDPASLPWYVRLPVIGPMIWQMLVVPGMAEGQLRDFAEPSRWPDWPDRYRIQMQYRGFGRALWSTRMEASAVRLDSVYATVGRETSPVLLIWGAEDRVIPVERSARVRAAIPRLEFHLIERAGHLPHMERTEVVNPILLEFLQSVD